MITPIDKETQRLRQCAGLGLFMDTEAIVTQPGNDGIFDILYSLFTCARDVKVVRVRNQRHLPVSQIRCRPALHE